MKRPEGFDRRPEPEPQAKPARITKLPRATAVTPPPARQTSPPPAASPAGPTKREARRLAREDAAIIAAATSSVKKQDRLERRVKRAESRRFTRSARRRRVIGLTSAGIVALLIGVLAIAIFSPLLALRTITVQGTQKVSASAVRSALDNQRGTPLALLDEARIRSDLGRFTLIRSYSTQVVPPNTLVVRIVERQPIAVVANGSAFDRIDAAGVVLSTTSTRGGYPVLDVGGRKPSSRAFRSAVQVLLALPSTLAPRVQAISATTADDVRLKLVGIGRTVVWGEAVNSNLKATVLETMLKQTACKTQAVIDVSAPRAPICGPEHSST